MKAYSRYSSARNGLKAISDCECHDLITYSTHSAGRRLGSIAMPWKLDIHRRKYQCWPRSYRKQDIINLYATAKPSTNAVTRDAPSAAINTPITPPMTVNTTA